MGKMKDLKYEYEERAQELAQNEYHKDFDQLEGEIQEKIYKRAMADITNNYADQGDILMDRMRDEEND